MNESQYRNLASEVPQRAWDLWEAKPDVLEAYKTIDASDYDGRSGDLSQLIMDASAENAIVDLGSGTYEMESTVTAQGDIVGIAGDDAQIYYVGTELDVLFDIANVTDLVVEGVTFDITEDLSDGTSTDVGVLKCSRISSEAWFEDVRLVGQRHRNQDLDGDGSYETAGDLYTFLIQVDEGATAFMHRCEFPYGGTDMSEETGEHSGHAIGPNADPDHQGLSVWKDCVAKRFFGNGFYMTTSEPSGENLLWNCHAQDNGKGGMRVSWDDTIIGGATEVVSSHPQKGDHPGGTPLVNDYGNNVDVIGLEIRGASDAWAADAIQIRTEAEEISFEKTVLHIEDGDFRPVRIDSTVGVDVSLEDIYWYDEAGASSYMTNISWVYNNPATVTTTDASKCRILSDWNDEFAISSVGTFTVEGTAYSDMTISADSIGLGDPLEDYNGLPEFYFAYENPPE